MKKTTNSRPTKLENIFSGRVLETSSIVDFCQQAGLTKTDRYHITPVLDGERFHHKHWYIPEFLNETMSVKDIYGNVYKEATIRELLKRKIITSQGVRRLREGQKVVKGVALIDTEFNSDLSPKTHKMSRIKFVRNGKIIEGRNINDVSIQLKMNSRSLYDMAYGFRDSFKGLQFKSAKIEKKQVINKLKVVKTADDQ